MERRVSYDAACSRGRDNFVARKTEALAHRAVSMAGGGAASATAAFRAVRWLREQEGEPAKPYEPYPGPHEICRGRCGLPEESCDGKYYVADYVRFVGWHSRPGFYGPGERANFSGAFRVDASTGRRIREEEEIGMQEDNVAVLPRPEWVMDEWRREDEERERAKMEDGMAWLDEWLDMQEGLDFQRELREEEERMLEENIAG